MQKLVYYVATSIDGFIAHADGTWGGFVPEGPHVTDYLASLRDFDVVLMGRKTYEVGLQAGITDPYPYLRSYVFSRTMAESPDARVTLVAADAPAVVRRLKQEEGRGIYLCGGGVLAATLMAEGLVDEIVVKLNPFVMGRGIPLFGGGIPTADLRLTGHRTYDNGVVFLYYELAQPPPAPAGAPEK